MNAKKTTIGATTAVAIVTGAYFYWTKEDDKTIRHEVTKIETLSKQVARTKADHYVRFLSADTMVKADTSTEVGMARLYVAQIPGDAQCNVIFEANVKVDKETKKIIPDNKNVMGMLNAGFQPVLISQELGGKLGVWNVILKGDSCLKIADDPSYLGSEMAQFINHSKKNRILRTTAKAGTKDSKGHPKGQVSPSDPDADPAAPIFICHEWWGLKGLNFEIYQEGAIKPSK
jgi:hypothetical protein